MAFCHAMVSIHILLTCQSVFPFSHTPVAEDMFRVFLELSPNKSPFLPSNSLSTRFLGRNGHFWQADLIDILGVVDRPITTGSVFELFFALSLRSCKQSLTTEHTIFAQLVLANVSVCLIKEGDTFRSSTRHGFAAQYGLPQGI